MEICMQQNGCFQDGTLYLLVIFELMVRFEQFLECRLVLIIPFTKYKNACGVGVALLI